VRDGLYVAVPVASAARQAPLGGTAGFVMLVVTPQYVAATDLERVLEPMLPPGASEWPDQNAGADGWAMNPGTPGIANDSSTWLTQPSRVLSSAGAPP
jgi:hypothetical protein